MIKLKSLIGEETYGTKVSRKFDNAVKDYLEALEKYENGITRQKMLGTAYFSSTNEREKEKALKQLKSHQKEVQKYKSDFEKEEQNYNKELEKELERHLLPQFR